MGAMQTISICLIIFLLLGVITVVLGVIFFSKLPPTVQNFFNNPQQQSQINMNYTALTLDSRDDLGAEIATNYVLKQGDIKTASGEIIPGRTESYNQIIHNITYDLYTYSDKYYLGHVQCNSVGGPICQTNNEKIGDMDLTVSELNKDQYQMTLAIENGTIRNPVWCFAWTPNIYYVTVTYLKDFPVPNYIKSKTDRCFAEDTPQSMTDIKFLNVYYYGQVSNDRIEITVYDLVQYLDNGILREELMDGNTDLGAANTKATITFTS
jgi:hypothetical protein